TFRTAFCFRFFACLRAICRLPDAIRLRRCRNACFQDSPTEFGEIDSGLPGRHRHQAVAGHTGHRVDLQNKGVAGSVGHEVHTAPAGTSQLFESPHGNVAEVSFRGVVPGAGAEVARAVFFVLGPVVVEHARRLDADAGQRLALENPHRYLVADDTALRQSRACEAQREFYRSAEFVAVEHLAHTYTRALARRLQDQRVPKLVRRALAVPATLDDDEIRRRDSRGAEQFFAAYLVHGEGGGHHPAPGVRYVQVFQCSLQRAVLAARSVQRDPDPVEAGAREFPQVLSGGIPGSGINVAGPQRFEHCRATVQRNLAFAGSTAEHHRHPAERSRIRYLDQLLALRVAHRGASPTIRTSCTSSMP